MNIGLIVNMSGQAGPDLSAIKWNIIETNRSSLRQKTHEDQQRRMKKAARHYGKELILDLHNCNPENFKRATISRFFRDLCSLIDMKRCKLTWWDDYGLPAAERQTEPHLKGTSAVQFIMTSNITIHTLDLMGNVYLNIFSCKDFDASKAAGFSQNFFEGKVVSATTIIRK